MKNTIKLEIHKAIKNKLFVISVLLGCAITILSLIYQVNVSSLDFATIEKNPMISAYTVFSTWIGGDGYSLGASVYFFIFPLLISIPYGWSYCEEKKNGYIGAVVVKAGKTSYFWAKYIAVFLTGGLAMVIPLIFNFLLAMLFFPVATPQPIYSTVYGIYYSSLMSDLFTHIRFYMYFSSLLLILYTVVCLLVYVWQFRDGSSKNGWLSYYLCSSVLH